MLLARKIERFGKESCCRNNFRYTEILQNNLSRFYEKISEMTLLNLKKCFEVVIDVSFSGGTAHVTCMKKEQDHLLDNQKKFIR